MINAQIFRGVSIHASAREATPGLGFPRSSARVSIHASAREATSSTGSDARMESFNPRLREGGDLVVVDIRIVREMFQSTPPRGRRHLLTLLDAGSIEFQSTPPRGRRLPLLAFPIQDVPVSIHASAREATAGMSENFGTTGVSIHASAREATENYGNLENAILFQSTPPRGRRPPTGLPCGLSGGFNPRLREGGDKGNKMSQKIVLVSIHASAREATIFIFKIFNSLFVSIHASAREATWISSMPPRPRRFNPRLREGGDKGLRDAGLEGDVSIHASAREATTSI